MFQSTRPRGARRAMLLILRVLTAFQSTRPRGARLQRFGARIDTLVSIHAPTRGATQAKAIYYRDFWFQSTRPRGARLFAKTPIAKEFSFNPRAHAGRDASKGLVLDIPGVSIHAPTRGATSAAAAFFAAELFQSTRPRGARRRLSNHLIARTVSIHAPTRGATPFCTASVAAKLFQSTRPRGARLLNDAGDFVESVSIHAPTRGATRSSRFRRYIITFQSTRPRGARLQTHN